MSDDLLKKYRMPPPTDAERANRDRPVYDEFRAIGSIAIVLLIVGAFFGLIARIYAYFNP